MREAPQSKIVSAHGVQLLRRDVRTWNGVTVSVLDMECRPGKSWSEMSPHHNRMSIVLEQIGGRVEPRTKIDQPCPSDLSGPNFIDFVPAGMRAWGYSDDVRRVRGVDFVFDFHALETTLRERVDFQRVQTPRLKFFDNRIFQIGSLLAAECSEPGEGSELYGDSLVAALAVAFFRLGNDRAPETKQGGLAPWQLKRAKEFMEANLSTSVRLSELADLTNLSQSRFGRAFKASTGLAPHRWQMNLRIKRAQQLLLEGELTLAQIALVTGFSEQSHLTRVFRKIVGVSPGSWRRDRRS